MEQPVHIIGRGIAGLAVAFELATRGWQVHLHGPRSVTGSATSAAVGVCSVKGNIDASTPLFASKIAAQAGLFGWLEQIERVSLLPISRRLGVVEPVFSLKGYEAIRERVFHKKFTGCHRYNIIKNSMLPIYLQDGLGGINYPADSWFDPIAALNSLEEALRRLGVSSSQALVDRIEDHPDRGLLLRTDSGSIYAPVLVVAAGVFTNDILERSGIEGYRQAPVEGESIFGTRIGEDCDSVLNFMKKNFVAYGEYLAYGSSSRPRTSIALCQVDLSSVASLKSEISRYVPYSFSSYRWGIRGRFRSQAPICDFVSTATQQRKFLFVSGFHKSGLQLAYYVARQAVDKLLNSAF